MAGLKGLFSKLREGFGNQRGYEGSGGGSGVKTPVITTADSDYGRQGRGERSPEYNDMSEGQFTNREDRNFARRFDPSDKDSVLQMQQRLNKMGYTDEEGNALELDGMFGAKTLSALRSFQGIESAPNDTPEESAPSPIDPSKNPSYNWNSDAGGAPGPWADYLFGNKKSSSSDEPSSIRDEYSKNNY